MARQTQMRAARAIFITALASCAAAPASAQLYEITHAVDPLARAGFASAAAYDPVHDAYFVVSGAETLTGRFIDRNGTTIGRVTLDPSGDKEFADVAYSPDVSNGAGGFGGFLTIWKTRFGPAVVGQIVSFPGSLVGPVITIRPTQAGEYEHKAGLAYSPLHHVFLFGVGMLDSVNEPTRIVRLDRNGQPIDDTPLSSVPSYVCPNFEFYLSCTEVDVVWNPISNEFGVLYNQNNVKTIARVSGNGTVLSRTPLGISSLWGALAVNTATGNYLAVGGGSGASVSTTTYGAEVSPEGTVVSLGLVTSSFDTTNSDGGLMRLSYSAASGTFLLAGMGPTDFRSRLLELNQHGVPIGPMLALSDASPIVVASHPVAAEWLAGAGAPPGNQYIIGTSTRFGGSDARLFGPPAVCITPDPFVAFGRGTCVDGGWYPPGMIPKVCTTPDPFVSLGGGRCVNGGWLPPIVPEPSPTPVPGGCLTPDPFVALGGGTCINRGWYPPGAGAPVPPPPSPIPGGCLTPDPFVAFGGGRCINGGWYPPDG